MGDCGSRFSESDLIKIEEKPCSKNNKFFLYILPPLDSPAKIYLQKKKKEFQTKLNFSSVISSPFYLYLIEVQKINNLLQPGVLSDHQSPFVFVSLEPNGPYQQTLPSDHYNPHWFRLVQFKSLTLYREIKLVIKGKLGHIFGNLSINLEPLLSQQCVDDWFQVENGGTRIKLRIQLVYNEKKLFKQLIDEISSSLNKL